MPACSYCDKESTPTREHVIPDWYTSAVGNDGLETFNARSPIEHIRGDILIKDVCGTCNNGPLSSLDGYGRQLHCDYFSVPWWASATVPFSYDYHDLLRWLLKLSYNSARAHKSDAAVLSRYRSYILGRSDCPSPVYLYAQVLCALQNADTPSKMAQHAPADSSSMIGPTWFRITQMRTNWAKETKVVQRQVYIDSYCFTILASDPDDLSHAKEIGEVDREFTNLFKASRKLDESGVANLIVDDTTAYVAYGQHESQFPLRYSGSADSIEPEFAKHIEGLIRNKNIPLVIRASRAEIEAGEVQHTARRLSELVQNREIAQAAAQRVAVSIDGYDNDNRELWVIPESKRWLASLFDECPFLFFLADPRFKMVQLLLTCYCLEETEGAAGTRRIDSNRFDQFMKKGWWGLNTVTQMHAMSPDLNKSISESIIRQIESVAPLK